MCKILEKISSAELDSTAFKYIEWRKLDTEDNYLISSDGQVKSTWFGKEKLLKTAPDNIGYLRFAYYKDGKKTTLRVHSCVAKVFLGDRSSEGLQVRHYDGNKLNNNKENLIWGTAQEDANDRIRHGTSGKGETSGSAKLKETDIHEIRELRLTGMLHREIADFFNVSEARISEILSGKCWAHVPILITQSNPIPK